MRKPRGKAKNLIVFALALLCAGCLAPPHTPTITTAQVPQGQTLASYSAVLSVIGGVPPYNWDLVTGKLPSGLALNSFTGVISGVPSDDGQFDFTVQVRDSSAQRATKPLRLDIGRNRARLRITTTSLPGTNLGQLYATTLTGTGGAGTYSWGITSGQMPHGLSLNASSGVVSGTPSQAGQFDFTVRLTDGSSPSPQTATQAFTIPVSASTLRITTTGLPAGQVGAQLQASVAATGGVQPYSWSISSGALPPGVSVNAPTGTISGVPSQAGQFNFVIQVTDSSSAKMQSSQALGISVTAAPLRITTSGLPAGQVSVPFQGSLTATGGAQPYTWSMVSGALPTGLSLNTSTGTITGTPSQTGTSVFIVQVADSAGHSAQQQFTISISSVAPPLAITTNSLPQSGVGQAYSATVQVSGGIPAYTWSITSGALPAGLSLSANTGIISGNPSQAGAFSFVVQVSDSSSPKQTASKQLVIPITSALQISTSALPNGQAGAQFQTSVGATGGVQPYTWSLVSGGLPSGLSLDASTGGISGTPTQAGTSTFIMGVKDSAGQSAQKSLGITISAAAPQTLAISTSALNQAGVGQAYSITLQATGGTPGYTWSITSGALPGGLSLNASSGVISGTLSQAGQSSFTVQVTDSGSPKQTASKAFSLSVIASALQITTSNLPGGQVGAQYQASLAASGGSQPYTWSLNSGALPVGLTLNPSTGAISGSPTQSGTVSFVMQVKDSTTQSAVKPLSIGVSPAAVQPLAITTLALPQASVGQAYSFTLQATGGTPSYSWSVASGQLPTGLSLLAATGQITGTPSAAGQFGFTIQVTDSASPAQSASQAFSLTLSSSPSSPTGLDQYGGFVAKPSPKGASGFFRVEKFGNRWMFVTPDGNAFWLRSVYHANDAFLESSVIPNKYGGDVNRWAPLPGRHLGATDRLGTRPHSRPVTPENIHATIYTVLGIDPKLQLFDNTGRPVSVLDDPTPIQELLC